MRGMSTIDKSQSLSTQVFYSVSILSFPTTFIFIVPVFPLSHSVTSTALALVHLSFPSPLVCFWPLMFAVTVLWSWRKGCETVLHWQRLMLDPYRGSWRSWGTSKKGVSKRAGMMWRTLWACKWNNHVLFGTMRLLILRVGVIILQTLDQICA